MTGITKRFGRVVANDRVNLAVLPGEVHCLLGENGAGKTTLMRIVFGLTRPDSGDIAVGGRPVRVESPSQAIRLGIGMVHQHFMLVGRMTVAENIVAGVEPRRGLFLDYRKAKAEVARLADEHGFAVDPGARLETLSVGMQQRVEILKALYRKAEVLILDEPTAVLTPQEVDELFAVLTNLKKQGKTVIFITHKLKETMAISDRITVLRAGRNVATVRTDETSPAELAEMMVGHAVDLDLGAAPAKTVGEPALVLRDVTVRAAGGRARLHGLSLTVRRGEVVGVAGIEGNGQLELEELVAGLLRPAAGSVEILGHGVVDKSATARSIRDLGVAYIPSDRLKRGLLANFSIVQNVAMGHHYKPPVTGKGWRGGLGVLDVQAMAREAGRIVADYDVRVGNLQDPASSLSGGNQQKLVVGRELSRSPGLVIAAQPTRGVDVGAVEFIHRKLLRMRDEGAGILLISAELDEILALSDRIAVLYEGELVALRPAAAFTERELGLFMAGQSREEVRSREGGEVEEARQNGTPA